MEKNADYYRDLHKKINPGDRVSWRDTEDGPVVAGIVESKEDFGYMLHLKGVSRPIAIEQVTEVFPQ